MDIIGLGAVLQDKAFQDGLARYSDGVGKMETLTDKGAGVMSKAWAVGSAAVAVGAAGVVAGIGAIVAISKTGLDALSSWNDQVNTLSDNLGTTGEQSSAWAVAFQHVGLSVEEGGSGLNFFVKQLDNLKVAGAGAKGVLTPFQAALKTLGVNAFNASGKLRTFDEVTPDILDAFQKMPPGIQKSALAMDLFGARAGTKFLDFLSQGSEGLEKARQMAKLYGLELDTDLSNAVEDFGFAMNDLNLGLKGVWVIIGKAVLPVAVKFVEFVNAELIPPLIRFAKQIAPQLAGALAGVASTVTSLWNVFKLLVTGDFVRGGIFGLQEDDIFIGALITARDVVIGLFDALSKGDWAGAWKAIANGAENLWAIINDQIGDPGTLLQDKFSEAIQGIKDWLAANGPATWLTLQKWAVDFWGWLSGPNGALAQVSTQLFILGTSLAAWIGSIWTTTISPALALWGTQFWTWLTGEGGAIDQVSVEMVKLTDAILAWANSPEAQTAIDNIGAVIGGAINDAVGTFFDSADSANKTDSALSKFIAALARSVSNLQAAFTNIGGDIADTIIKGMVKKFTGIDLSPEINEAIKRLFSLYLGGHPDLFAPLTPPPSTITQPAQIGGTTRQAGLGTGGGIGSLQVMVAIDGQEIKNAAVTAAFNATTDLFIAATAGASQ